MVRLSGRGLTIRRSLIQSFAVLLVAVSAAILVAASFGAYRSVQALSKTIIERTTADVADDLDAYFGNVTGTAETVRDWVNTGLTPYEEFHDLARLNALFMPLLRQYPQITSMAIGNSEGFEYMLLRNVEGSLDYAWYNRVVWVDQPAFEPYEAVWTESGGLMGSRPLPPEKRNYDPRDRPRYNDAELGTPYWSAPYYFYTTKDAGITAAIKWKDKAKPARTWIVSLDLLVADISTFTTQRQVSERGEAFVLLDDGSVVGLPRDPAFASASQIRQALRHPGESQGTRVEADTDAVLRRAEALGLDELSAVVKTWEGLDRQDSLQFRLPIGGERWWAGLSRYALGPQTLWIGVAVPENDFLAEIARLRRVVIIITACALLCVFGLAAYLARAYSAPLETLAAGSRRIRTLDFSHEPPVSSSLLEVRELAEAHNQMRAALESFSRYVPVDLVRDLVEEGEVARVGGRTVTLTIVFSDVQDFTKTAESMPAVALAEHLSEYFEEMLRALREHHGTIDKFVGDAAIAFWGAPRPDLEHTPHAVEGVLAARDAIQALNARWEQEGKPPFLTRFGLNVGEVVVGNIGAQSRLNYTVIGDPVNLASRLEALNKLYGTTILASGVVRDACQDLYVWRRLDTVAVKGKEQPVDVFELLGHKGDASPRQLALVRQYETALTAYQAGKFDDALDVLINWSGEVPADRASQRLLELCEAARADPEHWSPITRLHS